MTTPKKPAAILDKAELYGELAIQLRELLATESDLTANAGNMAALIFQALPDLNWAGFYFLRGKELLLGPFQGLPAVARIAVGKGVCGNAVKRGESVLVENVENFPGHIAGDPASRSELAIPLIESGECLGVFDLESRLVGRFDEEDREGCEALVGLFLAHQRALTSPVAPPPRIRRGVH
jgi:L-methionine (R)-S-oxide reductase